MTSSLFRDKDYLTTDSGVIFKVKSYSHPAGSVVAFPRFIPYDVVPMRLWGHTWLIDGREYSRFDVRVTSTTDIESVFAEFLKNYPQFKPNGPEQHGMVLVPYSSIVRHVTPRASLARVRALREPDSLQQAARRFADICISIGVPGDCLGVTDSLMFDAHTIGFSDIDFVISGAHHYRRVIDYLRSDSCDASIQFPSLDDWERRYIATDVKDMPLSPRVYALHKVRKREESFIDGHKLSLFAVRGDRDQEYDEVEDVGADRSVRIGPLSITGTVVDATQAMFRPSIFHVKTNWRREDGPSVEAVTIINQRREYISQVQEGEDISAFGLAHEVNGTVVLELGSHELRGRDYVVAKGLE